MIGQFYFSLKIVRMKNEKEKSSQRVVNTLYVQGYTRFSERGVIQLPKIT